MRPVVALIGLFVLLACGSATAGPAAPAEEQKIEKLIATVAGMKDAVFIRNGEEHSCQEAAEHMRAKWKRSKDEIETARDFIRVAASKSSMSGKPYLIKWKDGRTMKSADFLTARLDELEKK